MNMSVLKTRLLMKLIPLTPCAIRCTEPRPHVHTQQYTDTFYQIGPYSVHTDGYTTECGPNPKPNRINPLGQVDLGSA